MARSKVRIVLIEALPFGRAMREPGTVLLEGVVPEFCTGDALLKIAIALARGKAELQLVEERKPSEKASGGAPEA